MSTHDDAVLFVLAGTTDVQALVRNADAADGTRRFTMAKLSRTCHEALLAEPRLQFAIQVHPGLSRHHFDADVSPRPDADSERWVLRPSSASSRLVWEGNKVVLVPAKLDGLIERLRSSYRITAAIVFNTHRERSVKPDEPIAAGLVLSTFLAEQLGLIPSATATDASAVRDGFAQWVNVLIGSENMEGTAAEEFINPVIVRRIMEAVHATTTWTRRKKIAVCAIGGGFPNVKPVMLSAAELYYGARGTRIEVETERNPGRPGLGGAPIGRKSQPQQRLHARRQCLERIESGDFIGAGAIAAAQAAWDESIEAEAWYAAVRTVADWFARHLPDPAGEETSRCALVGSPFLVHWRTLTRHDRFVAIHTAFSLESALRQRRVVDALQLTYSLETQLVHNACAVRFQRLDFPDNSGNLESETSDDEMSSCMAAASKESRRLATDWNSESKVWKKLLSIASQTSYEALADFSQRTNLRGNHAIEWRKHRNQLVHGKASADSIAIARDQAIALGIWLDPKRHDGFCFLGHPLLAPVFEHLGMHEPRLVYRNIVGALNNLLLQPVV